MLPNTIFIGPDKTGSSWLHEFFLWHPETFVTPAKDTYFFDREFQRGLSWYERQFAGAKPGDRVIAELCHDYILSELACRRISAALGSGVVLITILRRPSDRAYSAFMYRQRYGHYGSMSFSEAVRVDPTLIDAGAYGRLLRPYYAEFGDQMFPLLFDELAADPQAFADALLDRFDIAPRTIPEALLRPRRAMAQSRSQTTFSAARRLAGVARGLGLPGLVGRVKKSPLLERLLFREVGPGESRPSTDVLASIDETLRADTAEAEYLTGLPLSTVWSRD